MAKKVSVNLPEVITKEMMDEAAADFLTIQQQIKELNERLEYKKSLMIKGMDKDMKVNTKKYQYLLVPATKKTLQAGLVEEIFKIKLTDACYKITDYNTFKLSEIIDAPIDTSVKELKLDDIKL